MADHNNGHSCTNGSCEPDRSKLKRKVVQSLIDHSYYNYSLSNVEEELSRRSSQGQYKNPKRKGLTTNFPAKLHKILSDPEFRHSIRWMVRAMCVFMSVTKLSRLHSVQFMHSTCSLSFSPFSFRLAVQYISIFGFSISKLIE
jgi:hypothetical protein